jgi:hypothetical protein
MKGAIPWLVRCACRARYRSFFSALAALVGPVQKIFYLSVLYFNPFLPVVQQAGQAAVLGRLSLSMCLWPSLVRKLCFLIFSKPDILLGSTTQFRPIFFKTHHTVVA